MSNPQISEVFDLTTSQREISEDSTIADAIAVMKDVNYNCLLVKNADRIGVGIISEHDIVEAFAEEGDNAKTSYVSDYMQVDVTCASDNDRLDDVIKIMAEENLRHIPIISDSGYVVSFVSIMELLMAKMAN